jgi:hypothetical protein
MHAAASDCKSAKTTADHEALSQPASFILARSMHMLWLASCVCRQGTNTPACARLQPRQPTSHQSAQGVVSYQDGILDAPSGPMQQTQVTPSNCQKGRLHPNPSIVLSTRMHA